MAGRRFPDRVVLGLALCAERLGFVLREEHNIAWHHPALSFARYCVKKRRVIRVGEYRALSSAPWRLVPQPSPSRNGSAPLNWYLGAYEKQHCTEPNAKSRPFAVRIAVKLKAQI